MTSVDLRAAVAELKGHTLCLSKDGDVITDDRRGIAPMLELIEAGKHLSGYSAADKVVGRAAAALFIKSGIKEVYACVLSIGGKELLDTYGIPCTYDTLTDRIINRKGTDICPMEKAVRDIDDIDGMYAAIKREYERMRTAISIS